LSEWDSYADDWDDDQGARTYAQTAYGSLIAELTARDFTLAGSKVCDFGCGTGLLTELMIDEVDSIDAVDTSDAMLAKLASKGEKRGWTSVRLSTELPTGNRTHDLVVCSSVLSFVDDYRATVGYLVNLLRPGGVFVQWDWQRDDTDEDAHGLTRLEISDTLADAGLAQGEVGTAFEVDVEGATMSPLMGVGERS
jgi:2-polyprenyl-3-methyl-5-hydroxy-6-metoxy-1,4-benzoquinol methylase